MEAQYNVYFAGELLPGQAAAAVRENLRKLFRADDATLDKLFSGRPQLIKRHCDKATALKYKQALERAGARPLIKRAAAEPAAKPAPAARGEPQRKPMTTAERVAAVAAASEPPASATTTAVPPAPSATPSPTPSPTSSQGAVDRGMSLAPPGSAVLEPGERRAFVPREVDTSSLSVAPGGQRLSEPGPAPPPAPDTRHLSAGTVGEPIPSLPRGEAPPPPDTSAISLSPEGSDLREFAPPAAAGPAPDLPAIELAPAGSDVLDARYRRRFDEPVPDTSHLALDDAPNR